jgi:hypothetical protein
MIAIRKTAKNSSQKYHKNEFYTIYGKKFVKF